MFSIIIATHDSERALVPTLAALVPGATAGIVREVIVADGGSTDETEQVTEVAGCDFRRSSEPLGVRLKAAAATARANWLMFLWPGVALAPGWIEDVVAFMEETDRRDRPRAAAFDTGGRSIMAAVRRQFRAFPQPQQGLVLAKTFYEELGGHRDDANPEGSLLRRIGRRRLTTLRTEAFLVDI